MATTPATQSGQTVRPYGKGLEFIVTFSVLTSDQIESLSYNYSTLPAATPTGIKWHISTAPTARCGVFVECNKASGNTTNKTLPVRFFTEGGGDITGAVVDIHLYFLGAGEQAVSP
jgi:hypothetical protein